MKDGSARSVMHLVLVSFSLGRFRSGIQLKDGTRSLIEVGQSANVLGSQSDSSCEWRLWAELLQALLCTISGSGGYCEQVHCWLFRLRASSQGLKI